MIVSLVASSEHRAGSGIISNGKDEDINCASLADFDFVRTRLVGKSVPDLQLYVGYLY